MAKRALDFNPGHADSPSLEQQKQELSERIREVERAQANNEVGPELQQRLADLELEYNDIEREAARQGPRSPRKAGHEYGEQAADGGYFGGEAPRSPSKPQSPSKSQAASRRQRAAPSGRVHDIEFATEISTSLLAQLRHLQGVLAEKDEALKHVHEENVKLQQSSDRFEHRLRELDDTEQRYKEQTWHLESQLQELSYQMKDANVKEQRLTQHLNASRIATSTAEREYDELRQLHDQLGEEHGVLRRDHDNEVTGLQRALASGDNERIVLNKRLEELLEHNEHLERDLQEHIRAAEAARDYDMMDDGDNLDFDRPHTPDGTTSHSPVKATPRVGNLESETLKSSLNHAHRMIQNLKNNIHREKTEKLELKRMLQDARDELEARKADVGGMNPAAVKRRKQTQQDAKRPVRSARLGGAGGVSEEIINDPTWEEFDDSPTRPRNRKDVYDLTTDASDAFETANEDGTETEGFRTADDVLDSDGELTETETTDQRRLRNAAMQMKRQTSSFESTASDDEASDLYDLSTPPSNQARYRSQLDRFGSMSEKHDSPASFVSRSSNPRQNLAAELDELDNSSIAGSTPGPRTVTSRDSTPQTATPLPMRKASLITHRGPMVDSGMMTEPYNPEPRTSIDREVNSTHQSASTGPAIVLPGTFPGDESAAVQDTDEDLSKRRSFDPSMAPPPLIPLPRSPSPNPAEIKPPVNLAMAPIVNQHIEPIAPTELETSTHSAPVNVQKEMNGIHGQTIAVPQQLNEGIEPSPISANGPSSPVSPIETPMDGQPLSSMSFVKNLVAHPPKDPDAPAAAPSQPVPEEPLVRDFAINAPPHRPAYDGIDTNKVLLDPHLRAARDQAQTTRQFQEPTLQSATPATESPTGDNDYYVAPRPISAADKGKKRAPVMSDSGTQTMVSADQIENLLKDRRKSNTNAPLPPLPAGATSGRGTPNKGRTLSMGSTGRPDAAAFMENARRPGSAGSSRRAASPPPQADFPPLPVDHREVIAAAARTPAGPVPASMLPPPPFMQPPPVPPSAWRPPSANRARTPTGTYTQSPARQATTPARGQSLARSEYGTPGTRRSSVSSFQSELDDRFGLNGINGRPYVGSDGFEIAPNTDPRMIQAITQTMIGEFLWKYTRKAGRSGEHSENRHKRFFWIHPYTRTLYWSQQDPSQPSQKELKAKSVPIQAVRVITDENIIPPGLHTKSLVVVTPSRSIKFTAPTAQRHETWFNALSYLLLRKDPATADETNAAVHGSTPSKSTASLQHRSDTLSSSNYTAEDVAEFNPSLYSRSGSRGPVNASRRSLNTSMGPPSTPRSNPQSSVNGRTASPQRSTPQQASLATRQSNAAGSAQSRTSNINIYPVMNQGTLNNIPGGRPVSNGGFAVPALPAHRQTSPQRTYDSPTKPPQSQPSSATADNDVDTDGFKKPRPASSGTATTTDTPRSGRTSRIGSMTGGWRASLFGRGRSKSRGRSGAPSEDLSSLAGGNVTGAFGMDGSHDIPPVPATYHEQYQRELQQQQGAAGGGGGGAWGGPAYINGVENVRACCDGE